MRKLSRVAAVILMTTAFACAVRAPRTFPSNALFVPVQVRVSIGKAIRNEQLEAALVTPDFFAAATSWGLGRPFVPEEYQSAKRARVVIMSDAFWRARLGAAPGIIGATMIIDGRRVTIVGVAPATFSPAGSGWLWVPDAGR